MIEVLRGNLDDARAEEVLAFWASRGALAGDEARQRLADVVCVLRDDGGALAGVCSVFATSVALIGGRRFWVFRSLLPGPAAASLPAMISATYEVLDDEFDGGPGSPIGLCLLADAAERRQRPAAEWSDPRMIYAGYLQDGRQVRIAYFDGARISRSTMYE